MSEIMGHKMLHSGFDFLVIGCRSDLFNSSLNSLIVNSWKWCLRFKAVNVNYLLKMDYLEIGICA